MLSLFLLIKFSVLLALSFAKLCLSSPSLSSSLAHLTSENRLNNFHSLNVVFSFVISLRNRTFAHFFLIKFLVLFTLSFAFLSLSSLFSFALAPITPDCFILLIVYPFHVRCLLSSSLDFLPLILLKTLVLAISLILIKVFLDLFGIKVVFDTYSLNMTITALFIWLSKSHLQQAWDGCFQYIFSTH